MLRLLCAIWAVILVGLSPAAFGQGTEEQVISGAVADSSGAVIPGAKVVIANVATGIRTELMTNPEGFYRSPSLRPGDYHVEVSKAGFQNLVRSGLTLHLAESLRLDLTLQLGTANQTIEVTGAAPVLNTEDARLGEVVEQKAVQQLPLRDRRAGGLIGLGPGVYYEGDDAVSFMAPRFNIAGSGNQVLALDGAPNAAPRTSVDQMGLNPPAESLQEVQVQESFYGSQYGGYEGGMIRMMTKSGANAFHGTLYEHGRNEVFDTRNFFSPTKKPDRYHLFGGSVGGPIRKNRAFFFSNVEGTTQLSPVSGRFTVPSVAMRQGNFSGLGKPIYDPATTRPDPSQAGRFLRDVFPGNIIPSQRFDPVATKVLSFYPDLTQDGGNNFGTSWKNTLSRYAFVQKVDVQLSHKDQFAASVLHDHTTLSVTGLQGFKNPAAIEDSEELGYTYRLQSYIFSETHTFKPNLINNALFAYRRIHHERNHPSQDGNWPQDLGIKNISAARGFPPFRFTGYMGFGTASLGFTQNQHPFSWSDTLTWISGKHTVKFGMDAMRSWHAVSSGGASGGTFSFDQRLTGLPGASNSGDSIASFLLGQTASAQISDSGDRLWLQFYAAPFVEDNIRLTPKLTLDVGARWELDFPLYEGSNAGSGFESAAINPVSGTRGVITFLGSRGYFNTDKNRIEPRVGLAYRIGPKTVIRGGYGIYGISPALGANRGAPVLGAAPAAANFSTPDNGLTPAFVLNAGFPAWPRGGDPSLLTPAFGAVPVGQNPTTSPQFVNPNWGMGYNQNFNLSLQTELPGQTLVEVAGIGSLGRHLSMNVELNEAPFQFWGTSGNVQARRPFPQFGSVTQIKAPEGMTDYYGLTVKTTKRLSHGLLVLGSFTWQKTLGVLGYDTITNHQLTRGVTLFEEANNPKGSPYKLLRISSVYDLPVGAGRRYLPSGPASWILGGWTLGGIFTYDSGFPFGLRNSGSSLNCFCGAASRLNQIGDLAGPKTLSQWFNTSAVAAPAFGAIGTLGVSPPGLVGPTFKNLDLSLTKTTTIKERFAVKLMWEIFNASNTSKFDLPGTSFGTGAFGKISNLRGLGSGQNVSPPWFGARIMQLGLRFEF